MAQRAIVRPSLWVSRGTARSWKSRGYLLGELRSQVGTVDLVDVSDCFFGVPGVTNFFEWATSPQKALEVTLATAVEALFGAWSTTPVSGKEDLLCVLGVPRFRSGPDDESGRRWGWPPDHMK